MSASQGRPRLEELSSLRYFAAVYIFLFHSLAMQVLGKLNAPHWFVYFSGFGYIAVSFFFVLSGFVLVYGYGDRVTDWWRFMRARIARIYPAYLLGLFFSSGWFFAVNLLNIPDLRWFVHHQVLTVASQVTMTQAWIPRAAVGWNIPGWAVSVFIAYYAAYPLVSRKMARVSTERAFTWVAIAWFCSIGIALTYLRMAPDGVKNPGQSYLMLFWLNVVKFNPVIRFSEFLMGVAMGSAVVRQIPSANRAKLAIVGGLGYLTILIAIGRWVPYIVMHTGLAAPGFALMIYGLTNPPKWTKWLSARPLTALGDASLSFYLLHAMVIGVMFQFGAPGLQVHVTWFKLVLTLVIATGMSLALHRWWEIPGRKVFDSPRQLPKLAQTQEQVASA